MKTPLIYILILFMTFMGTVASVFFKKATQSGGKLFDMIKNINLWIGGFIYAGAAVLNIVVLKYMAYSVVLPLTALTYVWTLIVSYLVLKEKITPVKIIGVALIVCGALLVVR
ncbi:MAG: EamA family transporter [Candidatus Fimenecus sp.]